MTDLAAHVQELAAAGYHHPHFVSAEPREYGRVNFTFRPFAGSEAEPERPRASWQTDAVSGDARDLMDAEYRMAHRLWMEAAYVHQLRVAAADAVPAWTAYSEARADMDRQWAALDTTASTMWKAAISRLVAAQDTCVRAARVWDEHAPDIARIHRRFVHSDLYPSGAYAKAAVPAGAWVVGDVEEYRSYRGTPLVRQVTEAVADQRRHLREVAALTGDPQT